jgi:hypothetical protein
MKTVSSLFVLAVMGAITLGEFQPSSTGAVSLIGGVIKARHNVSEDTKYPRKDCPVCKGQGWYISGDGIEKVECGYCEPPKQEPVASNAIDEPELVEIPEEQKTFILRRN